jgi:hypothetical protein
MMKTNKALIEQLLESLRDHFEHLHALETLSDSSKTLNGTRIRTGLAMDDHPFHSIGEGIRKTSVCKRTHGQTAFKISHKSQLLAYSPITRAR